MELRVLLDPGITLKDWPEPPSKVTLLRHNNLTLCGLLPQGALHLTLFTTGTPQGFHAHLNGPFTQFLWEHGNSSEALLDRNSRLLTLSQNNEFCVHDVHLSDGKVDITRSFVCDKDSLRQLCAESHVCVPSLPSIRLLSLCDHDILILVINCVLIHLRYTEEEQKPRVVSCLCLELDAEAAERISDVCINHEILFLLDSLGFIYAFDISDGSPVFVIELPARTDADAVEPLNCIRVSPNLDLLMVSSASSHFLPLKLTKLFSEDVTLCLHMWRDQRHLNTSSSSNDAKLCSGDTHGYPPGHGFQIDRSWDAMLSSLFNESKSYSAFPVYSSAQNPITSTTSFDTPFHWAIVGAGWVQIFIDNMKGPVSLHNWSLSSFNALFSLSDVDGHTTLAHWDMETQVVNYHTLGKALCVDGADDEACLIVTDQGLSLVLFAVPQNEFLTRLMIHGNASTADTLCYLNNWGRCSVPIHTLEPDASLQQSVGILSGYITKLRSFMRRFYQQPFPVQAQHAERENKAWEIMPVESIISDAILSNCIPKAQSFLRENGHQYFSLTWIKREGLNMVFKCLIENQVTEACQLLQNMVSYLNTNSVVMKLSQDDLLFAIADSLQPENCSALSNTSLHEAYPWFGFLVHMRQVSADSTDASRMFHASLSNAHVLMPGYQPSLNSMLLEGHTLLALATNMYAPGGIDGVFQQCEEPNLCKWNVDPPLLKVALAPYPKLKAALFPQHPRNTPPPPDITLYHLLQSLPPFHPSKFFTFQPTNPFATGDSCTELPHFSCPRLVSKYAIQEQLDYFFYLRSGRPSMAFYTFIRNQLLKSKDTRQLIQLAAKDVYALALSSFTNRSLVSSCVCFFELLGVSSHKLRVDVNVANVILKHTTANLEEEAVKSYTQELALRLLKLVDNETEAAKDLLISLEEVVALDLEKEDCNHCNGLWVKAVQFCQLHSIPESSLHLRHFAQKQDWLRLLVYANSREQIFQVLNDLNPVLASHIALALQDKGTADCPIEETDMETNPNTVHHVLQKCLSTAEPGQMLLKECMRHGVPLFSVLATCMKNADYISCMCAWIVTSVNDATHLEITQTLSIPEDQKWKLEDLTQIWNIVLGKKDSRTLHKAFSIFTEDCPLLLLLEVFELCMEYKDYLEAKEKILQFQKKLQELQSLEDDTTLLIPVVWLQTQASHLLRNLILQSRTSYEVHRVLQLLCDSCCQLFCGDLDIDKLRALTDIIEDQAFFIRRELLSDYSPAALQEECQRILQILLDDRQFSLAHQVATLAELPTDNLVIEEVLQNRRLIQELGQWECPQNRSQYWRKCHEIFNTNHLSPLVASNFFRSQASQYIAPTAVIAEQVETLAEQELLLTLAGHWLSKDDNTPLAPLEELEQQIWKCRIEREKLDSSGGLQLLPALCAFTSLTTEFSFSTIPVLNTPPLLDIATLPPLSITTQDKTDSSPVLSSLIDRLLDESKIYEASRVCRYFQLSHLDVWLVLSCRALASGEMSIHQLHPDIQKILTEGIEAQANKWSCRKRLQSSSSVESPSTRNPTDPIMTNLEILKDNCKHGKAFCRQLLCMYELSQDFGCSFTEVSSQDPSEILRVVLSKNRPELADRAQAVISSHGLAPEMVAQIVAEEYMKLLRSLDKEGQAEMYNVSEKRDNFLQFAKLCPDPTLVGLNLLEHLETVPLTELQAIIEVLIAAHDCFSLTCHLEGIRRVLHVCRHLTEMHLAPKQEYSLMVRLLSGIGRYNDMVYVFDILHKNQHFELLLRKQLDIKGGLQTALLEYIKRCHPGDSEKHNLTALCFSMHRDIGHNHEHAAKIQLKLIQSQPWEHWMSELEELKSSIMKALTLLIDAAESYSKDSCVRQSLRCARLTRLLTLQFHLLKSGHKTRLINLDRENLIECIMALPRFYQAVIVTEAYDMQPDWAEVLYHKVILGGDLQYLDELKQRQLLSNGVIEQISNKCKLNPPGATGLQNLKRIISCCEDINLRYNLAIENNFYDITDVLMRDSQTRCCLTDMLSQ
ncbi:spatacsin [Pyxicephalus adspersus]